MFRNYLAAALRNLLRNRLYAAINIVGLAVGLAGALLIALFIRDEYSYDAWIPGHERTFIVGNEFSGSEFTLTTDGSFDKLAGWMRADLPQIETVARLSKRPMAQPPMAGIRHGEIEGSERLYWADPGIFAVLPLPALAGDLAIALERPDGIVLTRRMARKYFGRDDPIGETLEIDRAHTMTVTGVIRDLPSNTHLNFDFLASGRAAFSDLTLLDQAPERTPAGGFSNQAMTYLRLVPGATIDSLRAAMPALFDRHGVTAWITASIQPGDKWARPLRAIRDIHLSPGTAQWLMKPRGSPTTIYALSVVAVLLIGLAGINFVSLMTSRATRRAVEVGIRKVSGAMRRQLAVQFLGESVIYVAIGLLLAGVLVAAAVPAFNAYLQRDSISFDFWNNAWLAVALSGGAILIGVLAGSYPAMVLPSFRPAAVLKSGMIGNIGSARVRAGLVAVQFAALIALLIAALVIYRQTAFAFNDAMRLNTTQMLLARTNCTTPFKDQVKQLSGVSGVACSSTFALNYERIVTEAKLENGSKASLFMAVVDFGFFELYGLRPLAGRFFDASQGIDVGEQATAIVLNEAAVRTFGFISNQAAIGKTVDLPGDAAGPFHKGGYQIVGVVPDFSVDAIHTQVDPIGYFTYPPGAPYSHQYLSIKLTGDRLPETLAAIDAQWKISGEAKPLTRLFLDQRIQELYLDVTRQSQLFAGFCTLAVFIACLGMFGLAAFTAESRTKEIGIRKAMGASRGSILKLLLWEFSKPVLAANLVAWPVGYLAMQRWLEDFAYHIDLEPWTFLAASAAALTIAVATVAGHAHLVARAEPVEALRYE